jgi:hypothetical protein
MITASHQVCTTDHPPFFAFSEDDAINRAEQRLPRPSAILVLRRHSRTGVESWQFFRGVE